MFEHASGHFSSSTCLYVTSGPCCKLKKRRTLKKQQAAAKRQAAAAAAAAAGGASSSRAAAGTAAEGASGKEEEEEAVFAGDREVQAMLRELDAAVADMAEELPEPAAVELCGTCGC
jgi:hypothetical protein